MLGAVLIRHHSEFIGRANQQMPRLFPYPDHRLRMNATQRRKAHAKLSSGRRLVDVLSAGTTPTGEAPCKV